MESLKRITAFAFFLLATWTAFSQKSLSETSWPKVATEMPEEWYGSKESVRVAENVLLYQRNSGGWPKNTAFHWPDRKSVV